MQGAGEDGAVHAAHDDQATVGKGRAGGADEGAAIGDGGGGLPEKVLRSARNGSQVHHDPAIRNFQGFGVETAPDVEFAGRGKGHGLNQGFGKIGYLTPFINANPTGIYARRSYAADQIQVLTVAGPAALFHGHGKLRQSTEHRLAVAQPEFIHFIGRDTADVTARQHQCTVHRKGGPIRRGIRKDSGMDPLAAVRGLGPDIGIHPLGTSVEEALVREIRAPGHHQHILDGPAERRRHPLRIRGVGDGFQIGYFHRFRVTGGQAQGQGRHVGNSFHPFIGSRPQKKAFLRTKCSFCATHPQIRSILRTKQIPSLRSE